MGKQVISIIIVIAIIGGVWYWSQTDQGAQQNAAVNPSASSSTATGDVHSADGLTANTDGGPAATDKSEADIEQLNPEEFPDVSADEVYKNADEALEAISRASVDYDDLVLQQFVALKDCAWCEPFYSSVKDLVLQTTDIDQNSFYAEVLAISAKRENIEFLVDQVKSDPKSERSEAIAEALEFAVTDDDTVQYLSNFLEDPSELLVESVAAAISNQGTVLAARILYDNAIKTDNPDGFYSVGVGLGEMIPEPEAFVVLQEQVLNQKN